MNTPSLNHLSPPATSPAPILEHPSLQYAGAGADPFLSILDAAATRAANHHVDAERQGSAARDDDEPTVDDEPIDQPQQSATNEIGVPIALPVDLRGAHGAATATAQVAAVNPAGRQHTTSAGDRSAPANGAAKNTAPGHSGVLPSQAATPAQTHSNAGSQSSSPDGTGDIDLQMTKADVKSKPTTMLSASETATAKPAAQLEPDLRAERYAELRANPANRLGGAETRLADLAGPPADAAGKIAASAATTQQSAGQHSDVGRLMAAATNETPTAQLLATAANAGPAPTGNTPVGSVPTATGAAGSSGAVSGTSLTATPIVDAAAPVGAVSRDGAAADAARTAAATRGQPAATARTVEQIAVQIKNGLNAGADKIHVRLQPAALGRVDIQLEVGHDQRVQAIVVVEKADTLEILERDARHLHRMLENAGFHTDNDSLTFRQQTSPDEQQPNGQGPNSPALSDADEPSEQTTESDVRTSHHDGLLDVEV